jgi:5-(carboxyamino)imidazole ribonucleotide synthase
VVDRERHLVRDDREDGERRAHVREEQRPDLPLGSVDVVKPTAIVNLLGDLWLGERPPAWEEALKISGIRLHLYGKGDPRPSRKMGHISAQGATPQQAVEAAQAAERALLLSAGLSHEMAPMPSR